MTFVKAALQLKIGLGFLTIPTMKGVRPTLYNLFNSLKYFSDILRVYNFEWLPILVFKDGL